MSIHTLATEERWNGIQKQNEEAPKAKAVLYDVVAQEHDSKKTFNRNIENFIGTVTLPVGIAGPLKVKGTHGDKSYFIPLATTEAALVASISRGCKVLNGAGGTTARVIDQRVSRSPVFIFDSIDNSIMFRDWIVQQTEHFKTLAASTTRFGKLVNISKFLEGNQVHLNFEYHTGNASGQNIATFATKKIFDYIKQEAPRGMTYCALEGGRSSDKQASSLILQEVRGRKVLAAATIPNAVLKDVLGVTAAELAKQHMIWNMSGKLANMIGSGANAGNVLAAMYIATGQDAACVIEGYIGNCRFELTDQGDLYCAITCPGLLVATVGGGTSLPSQSACLSLLGCKSANELAEVIASVCLAGELSIVAAFCADEFAAAHFSLSRTPTAKL